MIVRILGQAINVLHVAFSRAVLLVPQFRGPFKDGHVFGLMFDGDEYCLRFGESEVRVNVDSVLADSFFATSSTSRVGTLKKFLGK